MKIIAFTGLKGSGKDTAAAALVDQGYEPQKMAGGLKAMLTALLAYQGVESDHIERMLEGDLKEVPSEFLGGRTPRFAMQELGTAWGRGIMSESIWLDATLRRCRMFERNVITDVRFPNEVDLVHRNGGRVFLIDRGLQNDDPHPSEALVSALQVDGGIPNRGGIDALHLAVIDMTL